VSVFNAIRLYRDHVELADCPLSPWARSLWANLASRVNRAGIVDPAPKQTTLRIALGPSADGRGVCRSTVQRAQAELIEYGVLEYTPAQGRGHTSQYRLALADPLERSLCSDVSPAGKVAVQRRLRPVGDMEKVAVQHEKVAVQRSHIGEVEREVEEGSSNDDDTETPLPSDVSQDVVTAAWAAEIIARHYAGQVKTRKRKAS
jgi:hypothetical protein